MLTWKEHLSLSGLTSRCSGMGRWVCAGAAYTTEPLHLGGRLITRNESSRGQSGARGSHGGPGSLKPQELSTCDAISAADAFRAPKLPPQDVFRSVGFARVWCMWDVWMADQCQHCVLLILWFSAEFWSSLIYGNSRKELVFLLWQFKVFFIVLCSLM